MNALKIILPLLVIVVVAILYFLAPRTIIDTKSTTQFIEDFEIPKSFETEQILTREGIYLHGIWHTCDGNENGTIIFLHGIRGSTRHFLPKMKELSQKGYNTLAIDLRAHGKSGGKFCTFGYREKHDLQDVISYLSTNKTTHPNIGVWGQSLGGAIALQTLSIEPRLKFGIIESTFSDLNQIVYDYGNRILPFQFNVLHDFLLMRAGNIAHFEPQSIIPKVAARSITQPILLAHGTEDRRIKYEYGEEIFQQIRSKKSVFVTIEGANHVNLWEIGGLSYSQQVDTFLSSLE